MHVTPSNTAIFSPRGFRPLVRDPGAVVEVPAGSVWGADDVARLRRAGLVRVVPAGPRQGADASPRRGPAAPGSALGPDDLAVRTVIWLSLAGVPVSGAGLTSPVRQRLDPELLELLDRADPVSVLDPGNRELLSLELRRRARALVGGWLPAEPPAVVVLLPDGEVPPGLRRDLDAQTWPAVVRCPETDETMAAGLVAQARREGALYCTRMGPAVRYGPHHLADLVDALRHSGARVAHSPVRFRPWRDGSWLEDEPLGVEGPAHGGLVDGSLWYAVDGPSAPKEEGYAVHGANAVPAGPVGGTRPVALRFHRRRPAVLDWLAEDAAGKRGPGSDPVPPSYFAATGAPSRARSATTASES